jgi:flavin-dependent dehydrogenase
MAARTAARAGLKVLLVEKKQDLKRVRRYCTRTIGLGPGGFRSNKTFSDSPPHRVNVAFEVDHGQYAIRLKNMDVTIPYKGYLGAYYNETWVSPAGNYFHGEENGDFITGFYVDKEALLGGLADEAASAGAELRAGTACQDAQDGPSGVKAKLVAGDREETLEAKRMVLADGGSSPLVEKMGFNQGRPPGAPELKYLALVLDRIESPFPESTNVHIVIPSIHKGQVNIGWWNHGLRQVSCSASNAGGVDVAAVLQKVMNDSPVASWFARAKVVERFGCNQELRPPVREPARGNVICIGDNVAYAETAMKGAFGCGVMAAKASQAALSGGNGNAEYNDYWQHAFNFFSAQYSAWGRQIQPMARVLNDSEVDTLCKWVHDKGFYGLLTDVIPDHRSALEAELPDIAGKLFAKVERGGGRPGAPAVASGTEGPPRGRPGRPTS